jgi:hypothetical protein
MTAKLTRLTHKIAIQLHLVAKSCTILSSRSRRPVRKLLYTPSYLHKRKMACISEISIKQSTTGYYHSKAPKHKSKPKRKPRNYYLRQGMDKFHIGTVYMCMYTHARARTHTNQNDIHDEIKSRIRGRLAIIRSRTFCLPVSYQKILNIKIYKTVIFPVVLYGYEAWSLTLREEHRLRVSENRVLRLTIGPERDEDRSWRKLHNDELHNLYSSPNIVS